MLLVMNMVIDSCHNHGQFSLVADIVLGMCCRFCHFLYEVLTFFFRSLVSHSSSEPK